MQRTKMEDGRKNVKVVKCLLARRQAGRQGADEPIGGAYLAKPYSAKPESAVQESAKPYLAKPGNC